jgi:hypothetical protein
MVLTQPRTVEQSLEVAKHGMNFERLGKKIS